jgi:hypothetical protein
MVYKSTTSVVVALVGLDIEKGTYESLEKPHHIDDYSLLNGQQFNEGRASIMITDVTYAAAGNTVFIGLEHSIFGGKLYTFKLSGSLLSMKLFSVASIPDLCRWFNVVDDRVVMARLRPDEEIDRCYLDSFMVLDPTDGTREELDDTETCFQSRSKSNDWLIVSIKFD